MSLRLIKPGMAPAARYHPKTGKLIEPLYVRGDGSVVWPGLGAASDDPDDPDFTGEGGSGKEDDEDDEDEDDEDDDTKDSKKKKKSKGGDEDDDEDDEDDEDHKPTRPERQAARYRVKLREAEKRNQALEARLKAIEDKDKPKDEVAAREAAEAKAKAERNAQRAADLALENAILKVNTVEWADVEDMMSVAQREGLWEDVVDEDGTVDNKALRVALRDLAKRKPHLVKKPKTVSSDDDENDEEPSSRRTGSTMNGRRKGTGKTPSRQELAKKFPVLGR